MVQRSLVFSSSASDVLTAPASCGLLVVPDFLHQVQTWCAGPGDTLVVDLSEVDHVEMTMFRALVWARAYCAARGRELAVVEPGPGALDPDDEPLVRSLLPMQRDALTARLAAAKRRAATARTTPAGSVA